MTILPVRRSPMVLALILLLTSIGISTPQSMATNLTDADPLDELEIIRTRFVADLKKDPPSDAQVEALIDSLRSDGSWPGIDYTDLSPTGFEHSRHLRNMGQLSRALQNNDSRFHEDPALRNTLLSALDFWLQNDFISDNWWWNEMGTPEYLINTLLLIDPELTPSQRKEGSRIASRANLDGFGARPGGDLIKIAGTMGKRALFDRNAAEFEKAVAAMSGEVKITTGRGLQPDLSLQHRHDRVTSTLTYGYGYAASFAQYAEKLKGTSFSFPDETLERLIDYYLDGILKTMAHGKYPEPSQLNRGLTRLQQMRPANAEIPSLLAAVSNYRKDELEELIAVRQGQKNPAFTFNKFFWSSEYLTHHRPDYFTSVRLYSSRNHNVERPHNQEGLRNHYLADGSNFLLRTGREYWDVPPVYNWQRIPGTTVVQKTSFPPPEAVQQKGATDFVGGLSDGRYGAVAFDFESPLDSLTARKAWFFFDQEYVSLGSGIVSDEDFPVATTLNQTLLKGDVVVATDGQAFTPAPGEHSFEKTHWVWHDSVAYLFPNPARAHMKNTTATGNWRAINRQSWASDEKVETDLFTLWLDHGTKPQEANYEYIIVPGIEVDEVADYNQRSQISILANTPDLQAVTHRGLDLSQIAFYKPGKIEIMPHLSISVDQPSLVMVHAPKGTIRRITVSDPARKHRSLLLVVNARLEGEGEGWNATPDVEGEQSTLDVTLPDAEYAGKSVVIDFP